MAKTNYLKLILKGEVVERERAFEMPDGTILRVEDTKKIVVPSKKNQQIITLRTSTNATTGKETIKPVLLDSLQHQRWHSENKAVFLEWKDRIEFHHQVRIPIVRAKLKILFYFPTGHDRDLGNKAETIYDMLRDTGIIIDDSFKVLKPIYLDGWVMRDKPRTEIYLTPIDPQSPDYEWDLTAASYFDKQKKRRNTLQKVRRHLQKDLGPAKTTED